MFTAKRKELIEKMVKKGFDYVTITNIYCLPYVTSLVASSYAT